jgi:hypothetical protein
MGKPHIAHPRRTTCYRAIARKKTDLDRTVEAEFANGQAGQVSRKLQKGWIAPAPLRLMKLDDLPNYLPIYLPIYLNV